MFPVAVILDANLRHFHPLQFPSHHGLRSSRPTRVPGPIH